MSDLTNVFTDIADAIRAKTQTQITYKPTEMASAINNIQSGGGAVEITTGRLITGFNSPVSISDSVTSMFYCFQSCSNFNQPVNIPNSVTNMSFCFSDCSNFNQLVNISGSVTNMASCFQGCSSFNQPVNIPNSITIMNSCFTRCSSFNQPVSIPNSVTTIQRCFQTCTSFASVVRIACNPSLNVAYMFLGTNQSKVKTIITNNTSKFLATNSQSVVGASITWTQDGSNYYNATYNVYINYSPDPFNT